MNRKTFLQTTATMAIGAIVGDSVLNTVSATENHNPANTSFPLMDLHVHRSDKQSIEQIVEKSKRMGITFGVMENVAPWGITNEEFILMAKRAGLKFTFGSDTRDEKTGRLVYCKQVARRCGLTEKDFFVPKRKL